MELGSQKRSRRLCGSCVQVGSEFLEMVLTTGTGPKSSLASPTFSINTATDFVSECPLCHLLRASISPRLLDPSCMELQLCIKTSNPYLVTIEYPASALFGPHRGDLCLLSDPEAPASQVIRGRRVRDPGSDGIMSTIRGWARECHETHEKCRRYSRDDSPTRTDPELPTRVLDVSSPSGNPFLFVSNGARGKYTALSHCWGGRQLSKTTKATYQQHQQGIELCALSKTIQEGVKVTQALGLRYLWVDSLCIIQDDEADWSMQAMGMSDVYEQSYCTIAAAAAPDGTVGCFAQSVQDDCSVPLPHNERTARYGDMYLAKPCKLKGHFDSGPLFSRAWVIQERLLSPRVLHFAQDQVYWECHEQVVGETGWTPPGSRFCTLRNWLYEGTRAGADGPAVTNDISEPIASSRESWFLNFWSEFATLYSQKQLTVATDKIPALQGIAIRIQSTTKLRFRWGTFFDDTPLALRVLMWRRWGEFLRPNPAKLPSWTWASLDGPIMFHYELRQENGLRLLSPAGRQLHPIARLHNLLPATKELRLSTSVIAARRKGIYPDKAGCEGHCFQTADRAFRVQFDGQTWGAGHSQVCFDVEACQPEEFFLAPLFDDKPGHKFFHSGIHFHIYHLALEKQHIAEFGDVYRRIGLAMTAQKEDDSFPPATSITLV